MWKFLSVNDKISQIIFQSAKLLLYSHLIVLLSEPIEIFIFFISTLNVLSIRLYWEHILLCTSATILTLNRLIFT